MLDAILGLAKENAEQAQSIATAAEEQSSASEEQAAALMKCRASPARQLWADRIRKGYSVKLAGDGWRFEPYCGEFEKS